MSEFDQHAELYSRKIEQSIGMFGQDHDFFIRNKASVLLDLLSEARSTQEMRLLDVGCGVGLIHRYLTDQVADLDGVDVSNDSLAVARESNPGVAYTSYVRSILPYDTGTFDCAYAICVLHHVPVVQWQAFVSEMQRVTKPGGMVVVIEHNPINPATQWVVRSCELD